MQLDQFGRPIQTSAPQMFQQQGYMNQYTNKIFVTSRDDALSRSNQFNTVMMYVHQDTGNIIEVAVDAFGVKQIREFKTILVEEPKNESSNYEERIKALEEQIAKLTGGNSNERTEQ